MDKSLIIGIILPVALGESDSYQKRRRRGHTVKDHNQNAQYTI